MSEPPESPRHLELVAILRDTRMRRILSILRDRSQPLSLRDLSVELEAHRTGTAPSAVSGEDCQPIRVDLHHRCLPKLEAVGWIDRHPEGIITTGSFPFDDQEWALSDFEASDDRFWETFAALVAYPRRRKLLSILAEEDGPLTLEAVTDELADYTDASASPERAEVGPGLLGTLHHVDLPKLTELGMIEYDPDEQTIAPTSFLTALQDRIDRYDRLTEELM